MTDPPPGSSAPAAPPGPGPLSAPPAATATGTAFVTGIPSPSPSPSAPAHDEDDAELIAGSLEQPERFAALFDRYAPVIHRYAARRLGADAADDVTAETFLTAFRIRARFDGGLARGSARPWLFGIAAKLIGSHHRAEVKALKALARGGADPVVASWTESADDRMVAQAASVPLARALARLSAGDRHVLLLVAWADLSYQEVAQALDIPVGTVRSRLNRARRKVRAALAGSTPAPEAHVHEGGTA